MTEVSEAERKLALEIQQTDWSTAGNLSKRSSGVQIPRDICTRFGSYLYSTKCSWIMILFTDKTREKYRLATKTLPEIYRQTTKVGTFNRQPTK